MNDRLRKLGSHPMVALEQHRRELQARGVTVFDFGSGDAAEPTPPFVRNALGAALAPVSRSPAVAGRADLRLAIAEYLRRRFAVAVDPEREVLPTLGSQEPLFHLPPVLVQVPSDKDLVLYGEPADPVYEIGALFAEAWTYAVPLRAGDRWGMEPDAVPEAVLRRAAVVFLNSPHDPTGLCVPDAIAKAWVAAREQFGFTLVADESHADLWYGSARPRSLLEFGRCGCLSVQSLGTRSGMTGYCSGFVAGDADVITEYRRCRAAMGTAPQDFVQAASIEAWRDDAHVAERRAAFGKKREVMLALFAQLGLPVAASNASPFLWVGTPSGTGDEAYAERCRARGILVAPGSWIGRGQDRWFRVSLAPSLADCKAAAAAWPR